MKKIIPLITFIILLTSFIYAYETYEYTGKDYYRGDFSLFDADSSFTGFRNLDDPAFMPYVADLDNDGEKEIIVYDGSTWKLYNGNDLDLIDGYNTGDENITAPYIYDNDGDGLKDIIYFSCKESKVHFLEYNGTAFFDTTLTIGAINFVCSDAIGFKSFLKCEETTGYCVLISHNTNTPMATGFTRTTQSVTSVGVSGVVNQACFPKISVLEYADIKNNNNYQWFFSSLELNNNPGIEESIHISAVNVTFPGLVIEINDFEYSLGEDYPFHSCPLDYNMVSVSSPLIYNFDGLTGNGKEIIVSAIVEHNSDDVESDLFVFDSTGAVLDRYPTLNAEGSPYSPPFIADFYKDTGEVEACVMLYAPDNSEYTYPAITFLCASSQHSGTEHREFIFPIDTEIFKTSRLFDGIVHTLDMGTGLIAGRDPREFVTSFGVLRPNLDKCEAIFNTCEESSSDVANTLSNSVYNPTSFASLPINYDTARSDILILAPEGLYYLDDGYSPKDCSQQNCLSYLINPCLGTLPVKINETLIIQITVTDVDGDTVYSNATIYYGDGNQQDAPTQSGNSGKTFNFEDLLINKTVEAGYLILRGWEATDPTEIEEITLNFAITTDGALFGECTTVYDSEEATTEEEGVLEAGDVGTSCLSSDECDSEYCLRGICSLKGFKLPCTANTQCLSLSCVNNLCTKPSLFTGKEASKNEQFGNDSATNNLISLFLIIGIPIMIIFGSHGHIAGVIAGLGAMFTLAIFFAVIGWFSPFILIGLIVTALIGAVVLIILGGGGN